MIVQKYVTFSHLLTEGLDVIKSYSNCGKFGFSTNVLFSLASSFRLYPSIMLLWTSFYFVDEFFAMS